MGWFPTWPKVDISQLITKRDMASSKENNPFLKKKKHFESLTHKITKYPLFFWNIKTTICDELVYNLCPKTIYTY
jgi:hypothetical protein